MDTTQVGRYTTVFKVDLPDEYWKSGETDFCLSDDDIVSIPENPKITVPRSVVLTGYVMYPGTYAIRYSGERLAEFFKRAGGIRVGAYIEGARLFRKFNNAGLVPIDFKKALDDESSRDNVILYDKDSINVAIVEDVVYVYGEVIVPSPVLYKKGASLDFYLEQAGVRKKRQTKTALSSSFLVVRNGTGGLFGGQDILPGSSVYVPKKSRRRTRHSQFSGCSYYTGQSGSTDSSHDPGNEIEDDVRTIDELKKRTSFPRFLCPSLGGAETSAHHFDRSGISDAGDQFLNAEIL